MPPHAFPPPPCMVGVVAASRRSGADAHRDWMGIPSMSPPVQAMGNSEKRTSEYPPFPSPNTRAAEHEAKTRGQQGRACEQAMIRTVDDDTSSPGPLPRAVGAACTRGSALVTRSPHRRAQRRARARRGGGDVNDKAEKRKKKTTKKNKKKKRKMLCEEQHEKGWREWWWWWWCVCVCVWAEPPKNSSNVPPLPSPVFFLLTTVVAISVTMNHTHAGVCVCIVGWCKGRVAR